MLCQKCQQRQATVFFSQTVGTETTQAHLCEVCAQEQAQAYGGMFPINFNPFAAFSEMFKNFMPWDEPEMAEAMSGRVPASTEPQLQCPNCGYQLSTFRQNGRLGCTKCYDSFRQVLDPLISSIHGNVRHTEAKTQLQAAPEAPVSPDETAKVSEDAGDPQLKVLRKKLKDAIKEERYEDAALIRNEIRKIEKQSPTRRHEDTKNH
jgi:protein arginine kinase activator